MKTIAKTLLLVTGLGVGLALTGSLLAHGPNGFMGGPGMMQGNGMNPGMRQGSGMGPGMMQGNGMNPGMMQGNGMNPGMMQGNGMNPGMMQGNGMNPGMMQGNGMNPGMMQGNGMGPGMMGALSVNPVEYLARARETLGITPEQEPAWTAFADALAGHLAQGQASHQAMRSQQGGGGYQAHNDMHQAMWQSREKVTAAMQLLKQSLTPEQQHSASTLLGQGCMG